MRGEIKDAVKEMLLKERNSQRMTHFMALDLVITHALFFRVVFGAYLLF